MPPSAVWFDLDESGMTAKMRSPKGYKLVLSGTVDQLEPEATGDPAMLANVALRHNLWAYAGYEHQAVLQVGDAERAPLRKKADSHAEVAVQLAGLIDGLVDSEREGWCSNCFEFSAHRKATSVNLRTSTYLCAACGSATDVCAAPGCTNMAARGLGSVQIPRFCAEHSHAIPSFERARDRIEDLLGYEEFLNYDKPNLARGVQLAMGSVLAAGALAPLAIMAAPALGGAVGILASSMGSGATLSGAAAANYGLALVGGGSLAAGGLGMAGGAMVISAMGTALGGALGASVTNAYVRDDKSFRIERFREGVGTPIVIARGFTTEGSAEWWQPVERAEESFPDSPIYFLHWGSKELADLALFVGVATGNAIGKTAVGAFARKAGKKAAAKLGPVLPAVMAADLAKNPWHVARVRADKTGVALAGLLARFDGEVILMGHSLGGRVMATATQALAKGRDKKTVKEVHLAGAAIGQKFDWSSVGQACSGDVYNYFSTRDPILKVLYTVAEGGAVAAGRKGTGSRVANVHDVDVSACVEGHGEYWRRIRLVEGCPS